MYIPLAACGMADRDMKKAIMKIFKCSCGKDLFEYSKASFKPLTNIAIKRDKVGNIDVRCSVCKKEHNVKL